MNSPLAKRQIENEPFRSLIRLHDDFERFVKSFGRVESASSFLDHTPSCELTEDKKNYFMKFDIPGVKKDDVKIELEDNMITVSAERHEEKTTDGKKNRFSEINYGRYERSFTLPASVDEKKVDASFRDGVLMITMPKTETSKAKQIAVK